MGREESIEVKKAVKAKKVIVEKASPKGKKAISKASKASPAKKIMIDTSSKAKKQKKAAREDDNENDEDMGQDFDLPGQTKPTPDEVSSSLIINFKE